MTYVKRKPFFRLILRAAPAAGAVALAAVLCTAPARGADYAWPVIKVIDGDTVAVDASADLPPELSKLKVRLDGVDAPGIGRYSNCRSEEEAGQAAKVFAEMQIGAARRIVVRNPKWDKYGGRVLAHLILDGKTLSALLIEAGHGRLYRRGKRRSWCAGAEN